MAQHHSDTAATVAFRSDIERALARRTADMPLHSQVRAGAGDAARIAPENEKTKGKAK